MRRLPKIKPAGRGFSYSLPETVQGGAVYYPFAASLYYTRDEFAGTTLDADWVDVSTLASGGAAPTVASSFLTLATPTATASTSIFRVRSAYTSIAHLYSPPFRVIFDMRIGPATGAGIAPTGGLDAYVGIRDTGETHIAQFHLNLATAGSSSLASPVYNVEIRASSTAAAFIASAAHNLFSTALGVGFTATSVHSLMVEHTGKGIFFGARERRNSPLFRKLSYFDTPVPRADLQYFLDMQIVADGTAGYTQTDAVQLEIDAVTVEQIAPWEVEKLIESRRFSDVKTAFLPLPIATASAGYVAAGPGIFMGLSPLSTATAALETYLSVFDAASGAGSNIYVFGNPIGTAAGDTLLSAASKLLWIMQGAALQSAAGAVAAPVGAGGSIFPPEGIPFHRGLWISNTVITATATAATVALSAAVSFRK